MYHNVQYLDCIVFVDTFEYTFCKLQNNWFYNFDSDLW